MSYPILAANSSWYKGTATRSTVTQINIVDSYTPTGSENENWNADVDNSGSIKCYRTGTVLTIAGNGSGKIAANSDSSFLFSDINKTDYFSSLTNISGSNVLDTSSVTSLSYFLYYASAITSVDFNSWDISNVTNLRGAFTQCTSLISIGVESWDVSSVQNMYGLFNHCFSLPSIDLSRWDTRNVENMAGVFQCCNNLTSVDSIKNWDTSSVTIANHVFMQCYKLTEIELNNWDVSNITDINHMFSDCFDLKKVNINKWNTSNLKYISAMFNDCSSLTEINLSGWDTRNLVSCSQLFERCSKLTKIIGLENWNTSNVGSEENVADFYEMFYGCSSLTELDLSSFDTSKSRHFTRTFSDCTNLKTIYVSDKWNTAQVTDSLDMFTGCTSLVGGAGTVYSSDHVDYDYARIDGGTSNPGYLTNIDDSTQLLIKTGTLHKMGLSVRNVSGETTKYTPSEMVDVLKSVDSDISEQSELIYRITNVLEGKAAGGGGGDASKAYDAGFKDAIERYAPEFTESGAVVTCYPIGGFPLNVVSQITPIQAGSGDASPTNIRPLSAHTAVKVTIANDAESIKYNTEFGQEAYCGTFDWSTGLLTLTNKMLTLTGNESGWSKYDTGSVLNFGLMGDSKKGTSDVYGYCSHVKTVASGNITWSGVRKTNVNGGFETYAVSFWGLPDNEVSTWTNYLKEQANSGTPVQILYQLEVPITVQLTPREILSLDGANNVYSDTGDTTVTGKGDWTAMVANLATEADYQEALREMGVNV